MRSLVKYTTILFDADNTLFDFYRAEREALVDALRFMKVEPNEDMIGVYSGINDALWKKLERGEISKAALREERFHRFCAHYALTTDVPRLAVAYTDFLTQKRFLMDGALEACKTLSERCRLYIITNGISSVQRGRFEASPLSAYIQKLFISEEIGCEKPCREYFDAVASAIPCFDADKTLVVGDSLSSDIKGGILAGIDTCWMNPSEKPIPDGMPITYVVRSPRDVIPLVLGKA